MLEAGKDGSCKNGKDPGDAETWSREIQNALGCAHCDDNDNVYLFLKYKYIHLSFKFGYT